MMFLGQGEHYDEDVLAHGKSYCNYDFNVTDSFKARRIMKSSRQKHRQASPSKGAMQWNLSGTAQESMIPKYDAENDKHCRLDLQSPKKKSARSAAVDREEEIVLRKILQLL